MRYMFLYVTRNSEEVKFASNYISVMKNTNHLRLLKEISMTNLLQHWVHVTGGPCILQAYKTFQWPRPHRGEVFPFCERWLPYKTKKTIRVLIKYQSYAGYLQCYWLSTYHYKTFLKAYGLNILSLVHNWCIEPLKDQRLLSQLGAWHTQAPL